MKKNGSINVQTENIFPIIKKFLYSDHEIFLRELVSNAVDATQKLKTLKTTFKNNFIPTQQIHHNSTFHTFQYHHLTS